MSMQRPDHLIMAAMPTEDDVLGMPSDEEGEADATLGELTASYRMATRGKGRAKDFNLQQHMGQTEGGFGVWDSEVRAQLDLMTLKGLFFGDDWVFIVVDAYAAKLSTLPLKVMRWEVKDGKEVAVPAEGHPVQDMLDQPNPFQDYHAWMYAVAVDEMIGGNSINWWARASKQIYQIPVETIRMDIDAKAKDREVKYTVYAYSDELFVATMHLDAKEVCHIRRPNPSSMLWGLSPFVPGRRSILFNRYSQEYLINFYQKGASPQMVLELGAGSNEKKALRMARMFEQAYTGRRNQRRTLVLPRNVKANTLSHKISEQELGEHIDKNRETILALAKVPKHALSLQEAGSLGSEEHKVALREFYEAAIIPGCKRIAGALSKTLAPVLGDEYFLQFDTSEVLALKDDEVKKAELAGKLLATHTLNEVRKKVYSEPPLKDGDRTPGTQPVTLTPTQPALLPSPTAAPVTAKPEPTPAEAVPEDVGDEAVTAPDVSLNGAQVAQLRQITIDVAAGTLSPATATELVRIAFALKPEDAAKLIASIVPASITPDGMPVDESGAPTTAPSVNPAPDAAPTPDENPPPAAAEEGKDVKPDEGKGIKRAQKLAAKDPQWWERRNAQMVVHEADATETLAKVALRILGRSAEVAVKAVRAAAKSWETKATAAEKKKIKKTIESGLRQLEREWKAGAGSTLMASMDFGYGLALETPFGTPSGDELAAIRERNAVGRRAILEARAITTFANMSKTTTDQVMDAVDAGIAEGKTLKDIAKDIAEKFRDVPSIETRASTIARTEALTAVSLGQAAVMEDAAKVMDGKLVKMWVNAGDTRVRGNPAGPASKADHWSLQGELVAWDQKFSNGLAFPRDPAGEAAEVINCRCSWVMVPEEDAGKLDDDLNTES